MPLDAQDASRWDAELIALGEHFLHRASALGGMGRFQIEAAIQRRVQEACYGKKTAAEAARALEADIKAIR